jgi:hypothetical protein
MFGLQLHNIKGITLLYLYIYLSLQVKQKTNNLKNVLLTFVGTNDVGQSGGKSDGAILTIFKERRFDEVHLLWNPTKNDINFYKIACHVRDELKKRKLCKEIILHDFECDDVTNHNEIYPKLLEFCKSLTNSKNIQFTAGISSGTPSMQVCWILMAESGDFSLSLIRSREPRFGKPYVTDVKLDTGLPRIKKAEQEIMVLKKDLLPCVNLYIKKGICKIDDTNIPLSPIQFSYYRYFLERAKEEKEFQRFSGLSTPNEFLTNIIKFHEESFPDSELFRQELKKMLIKGLGLDVSTFRSNISKLNSNIKNSLHNKALHNYFIVNTEGKRHALRYGVDLPPGRLEIK